MPPRRQPPTVRLRRLATELRGLRTAARRSREDIEEATGINATTLYRIETARVRPQRRTLLALLDQYGIVDPAQRDRLVSLSRASSDVGWLAQYEEELNEVYSALISLEADAAEIRNYESLFIPGLLQTKDYAGAVIAGVLPQDAPEEVARKVDVRMQRQHVLTRSTPLKMMAIIDQAALMREVGGEEIMRDQLGHLLDLTNGSQITLQVIPYSAGAHPGMPGSFVLMSFTEPDDSAVVYIDSVATQVILERPEEVERYGSTFDRLSRIALSPTQTRTLINSLT